MGTYYKRTNPNYLEIGTTRTITLTESTATQVFLDTGYNMMTIVPLGPSDLVYGDSSILVSSAGLLYYSQAKTFDGLSDNFSFYARANSYQCVMAIIEYRN